MLRGPLIGSTFQGTLYDKAGNMAKEWNLGVVERGDLTGFNWADVPAVLVETGFMSNPREAALLRTARYQQRLAGAIARGAQRFVTR